MAKLKGRPEAVLQKDLQGNILARFESIKICSEELKICYTSILHNCQGVCENVKGFIFQYADKVLTEQEKSDNKKRVHEAMIKYREKNKQRIKEDSRKKYIQKYKEKRMLKKFLKEA